MGCWMNFMLTQNLLTLWAQNELLPLPFYLYGPETNNTPVSKFLEPLKMLLLRPCLTIQACLVLLFSK